jgi:hypothetical protein
MMGDHTRLHQHDRELLLDHLNNISQQAYEAEAYNSFDPVENDLVDLKDLIAKIRTNVRRFYIEVGSTVELVVDPSAYVDPSEAYLPEYSQGRVIEIMDDHRQFGVEFEWSVDTPKGKTRWQSIVLNVNFDDVELRAALRASQPVCEHNHTVRHTYAHIPQGYDECSQCGATRVEGKDWRTPPWADHPECDHLMKWGTHDENGCSLCSLCSCLTAAPTEVS